MINLLFKIELTSSRVANGQKSSFGMDRIQSRQKVFFGFDRGIPSNFRLIETCRFVPGLAEITDGAKQKMGKKVLFGHESISKISCSLRSLVRTVYTKADRVEQG